MKLYEVNISDITYVTKCENTDKLPTSFNNVILEMDNEELDMMDDRSYDFVFNQAVGMYILNQTGWTPDDFKYEVEPF